MSFNIESLDELEQLVKRLGVKVQTVDDLRKLLATINVPYDAEMARERTLRLMGAIIPAIGIPLAGLVSLIALAPNAKEPPNQFTLGAVAVIWGTVVLLTIVGMFLVLWSLRGTRNSTPAATGAKAATSGGSTGHPASPATTNTNNDSDPRFTRIESIP